MHLEDNIREEKEDLLLFIQVSQECNKPDTTGNIIYKVGLIQKLLVSKQISNEETILIEKKMDILKILNKTDKIHFKATEKVNIRKNIDSQIRFYSTKKRTEKNQLQKPSLHEVNTIQEGLGNDNHAVNIHSAFDHTYDQQ